MRTLNVFEKEEFRKNIPISLRLQNEEPDEILADEDVFICRTQAT
jgi:hypothetical protein